MRERRDWTTRKKGITFKSTNRIFSSGVILEFRKWTWTWNEAEKDRMGLFYTVGINDINDVGHHN